MGLGRYLVEGVVLEGRSVTGLGSWLDSDRAVMPPLNHAPEDPSRALIRLASRSRLKS